MALCKIRAGGEVSMVSLEMTEEEADVLEALLRRELSDLKLEIHHTDLEAYREELRVKQERLGACLGRVEAARTHSVA